jgi:hypothetical protein
MKKLLLILTLLLLTAPALAQVRVPVTCSGTWVNNNDGTQSCVTSSTAATGSGNSSPNGTAPATTNTTNTITPCGPKCNLGYTPLEPIPGLTTDTSGKYDLTSATGFANLINAIFKILISGGALIAVLSLTIGGVQYMTANTMGNKKNGLDRAKASIYGILLIAAIYIILNTINPHLLSFNFNPCPVNSSTCSSISYNPTIPSAPQPNVGTMTQTQIQAAQANGSIPASVTTPSDTFTFVNGSAGQGDLNSQFATFQSSCSSRGGSVQSGPQVNNGGTLTMICEH